MTTFFRLHGLAVLLTAVLLTPTSLRAEHEGKVQILILGDSTAEGSVPRKLVKEGPHLEDVIRQLLAAEGDLPPCNVINVALSGEYIQRLVDSGRYDKVAAKLPGLDYIFIRYGLRNALLPQVTALALALATVVSGAILVEAIFNYPGLGGLLFASVVNKDIYVINGIVMVLIITLAFTVFLIDLAYMFWFTVALATVLSRAQATAAPAEAHE